MGTLPPWASHRRCTPAKTRDRARRLDISLLDVQIALQGHLGQFYLVSGDVPKPIGSSHPANLPVGAYQAQDGGYIQVHCASQEFDLRLLEMLSNEVPGMGELAADPRFATQIDRITYRDALDHVLGQAFATKPRQEWVELCEEWNVPGGPVNNIAEALADPQVQLRNMVVEIDHSVAGKYKTAGNPIKTGGEERLQPPPTLGEHTDQMLLDLLGYSSSDVAYLRQTGAV